jgi:hypothetical protein
VITKKKSKEKNQSDNWVDATKFWRNFSPKFVERTTRQVRDDFDKKNSSKGRTTYFRPDTPGEKRILRIYEQYKAIELQLKDILTTVTYLKLKGIDSLLKQNSINKIDYIRFNYENYLIRVASFPDILSILGDTVYETGLPERDISWNSFTRHKKTQNLECSTILTNFATQIKNLRHERHRIIHYGGHKNEIIETINNHTIDPKYFKDFPITKREFQRTRVKEKKKLEDIIMSNHDLCLKYTVAFMNSLADDIQKIELD